MGTIRAVREPAGTARPRNPWWIPPFLGRVPDIPQPQIRLLGSVGLALLFEQYDQTMLNAALKQIAESFGVGESDLGSMLGYVRLGALPAFLLIPWGDWLGRRRLFLISVVGLSLATVGSAFARNTVEFIALQMISRAFMVTCSATAFVIITEEFPKDHRGWGIGMLGALGAFGSGLSLLLFAGIDTLPYGWRALYLVGATPLLLLPRFRRRVRETGRFRRQRLERESRGDAAGPLAAWLDPMRALLRTHPWRALAVGAIGSLSAAGHGAGFNFSAYYVQTVHGWAPAQFTAMAVIAGAVGIIGHPFAGRFADHHGRRRVGLLFFGAFPFLALGFYHSPGWALPLLWIPLIFTLTGGSTIARALATELFPTSHRGTAAGWLQLVDTLGAAVGLFLVSWGTAMGASNIPMISAVVFATGVAGLVVLMLPETGRRELEEISEERMPVAGGRGASEGEGGDRAVGSRS
jgi:putative MFS transporter